MEIKFENVSFVINIKTPLEKTILRDVSFTMTGNKIYGVLGNSNSGKTCIAELVDALVKPTKGSVYVNNFVNNGKRIKKVNKLRFDVGYVFKNPYDMFFNKTVKKEIEFGMRHFRYKMKKIKFRPADALKMVGLKEEYLTKKISDLSLREARKVSLAATIVFNPKILILDEPTIGLNSRDKKDLIKLLKIMRDKYNRMVIVLSKDTDFLYQFSDYLYVFSKSRLVMEGERSIFKNTLACEMLGLKIPDLIRFSDLALKQKNVKLNDYKDIKDLIKGVCRNVF